MSEYGSHKIFVLAETSFEPKGTHPQVKVLTMKWCIDTFLRGGQKQKHQTIKISNFISVTLLTRSELKDREMMKGKVLMGVEGMPEGFSTHGKNFDF